LGRPPHSRCGASPDPRWCKTLARIYDLGALRFRTSGRPLSETSQSDGASYIETGLNRLSLTGMRVSSCGIGPRVTYAPGSRIRRGRSEAAPAPCPRRSECARRPTGPGAMRCWRNSTRAGWIRLPCELSEVRPSAYLRCVSPPEVPAQGINRAGGKRPYESPRVSVQPPVWVGEVESVA
jgi:hypothetical protein